MIPAHEVIEVRPRIERGAVIYITYDGQEGLPAADRRRGACSLLSAHASPGEVALSHLFPGAAGEAEMGRTRALSWATGNGLNSVEPVACRPSPAA
jgi:hypothetical protein